MLIGTAHVDLAICYGAAVFDDEVTFDATYVIDYGDVAGLQGFQSPGPDKADSPSGPKTHLNI